jgi:HSP20 family molecular chaperone IbpA
MSLSGMNRQPWLKWEQIEKFLGQKLPQTMKDKSQSILDNMSWVEDYVQDVVKNVMPKVRETAGISSQHGLSIEVFETHEHVIAQVKLPKEENPRALQVLIRSDQIKLTGFLDGKPRFIKLPSLALPRTAKARYKQPTLQIQFRKRGLQENYHETYIRF